MFPIRRNFEPVEPEWLERFASIPAPLAADGNAGAGVLAGLRPLDPESRLVGPALTVHAQPGDNLIVYRALEEARPGDILVVRTGAHRECALIGDIVAAFLQRTGVAGLVTDGLVRDEDGIRELGFPAFCAGVHPAGPGKQGGYGIGYPVVVGGALVRAGDLIVGDRDGVVALRRSALAEVWARIEAKEASEAEARSALAAGERLSAGARERLATRPYEVRG